MDDEAVLHKIIKIQSFVRGYLVRKKFGALGRSLRLFVIQSSNLFFFMSSQNGHIEVVGAIRSIAETS